MLLPMVPALLLILQPLHQTNKPLTRLVFTDWWHVGGLRCMSLVVVPRQRQERVGGEAVLYVRLNGNGGEHTHALPPVVHDHFVACSVAIGHGRPLLRRKPLPVAQRKPHRPQCKA